ncbi:MULTISPECIES: response regulator [unclassified Bradyrhizobium]|uniref:response regulator n=1 Tax=unclassified Bradyrhizobium TaxID=2631580 RepID=UPI001FF99B5A|nr:MULTISPECIES: response regulator [unclassified Bradyrhizobium]
MVEELGHRVVAEAGSVDDARSAAQIERYDLAILDINLHGTNLGPVAEIIKGRGLPFFFLSGYGSSGVPHGFEGTPVVLKPCTLDKLPPETLLDPLAGVADLLDG